MGAKHAKLSSIDAYDLSQETNFLPLELQWLHYQFYQISNSIAQDGVIDLDEFREALGLRNKELARRIFAVFDENADGVITFEEFVKYLSVLSPKASLNQKLNFSFRMFDVDNDGFIDKKELQIMLEESLREHELLKLSSEEISRIIDSTFNEVDENSDGKISFQEYSDLAHDQPSILDYLTIDIIPSKGDEDYDSVMQHISQLESPRREEKPRKSFLSRSLGSVRRPSLSSSTG